MILLPSLFKGYGDQLCSIILISYLPLDEVLLFYNFYNHQYTHKHKKWEESIFRVTKIKCWKMAVFFKICELCTTNIGPAETYHRHLKENVGSTSLFWLWVDCPNLVPRGRIAYQYALPLIGTDVLWLVLLSQRCHFPSESPGVLLKLLYCDFVHPWINITTGEYIYWKTSWSIVLNILCVEFYLT